MQQLLLDVFTPPLPTLENFIAGENAQALEALKALHSAKPEFPCIYLYGPPGCGKSHLLRSTN
ncbi:MAG: DnaA regulatory inactivator Hda, partial [Limnobacter sp.]|nr:DnaA regulatory inactivator Hda [Limnobacter sp.]